ncbi:MAG: hypothetical protein ACYC3O_10195 [Burkholderiales bacterium]
MHAKQVLGLTGSLILLAGVFTPIVSIPVMGDMTYFQNGRNEAIIVLVLAVVSLILAATKLYKGLWLTGIGSFAVMLYTFFRFQSKMSEMKSDMESPLAGTPLHGLVDMAMQSVQFQWGWAVLLAGAGLILAAVALKEN